MGRTIVATLCEGDYWCGASALANSLAASGFRGVFRIGYRGQAPMWAQRADGRSEGGFAFSLFEVETDYHLTHYKPEFLLRVAGEEMEPFDRIALIDVDAMVDAPWSEFDAWIDRAIAVCEDVNGRLPFDAPKREGWRRFFQNEAERGSGYAFPGPTGAAREGLYANGGFIGLRRERLGFLTLWRDLVEAIAPSVGGLQRWCAAEPGPFHAADQDSLNVALMLTEEPVEFAPASAMGFAPGRMILPHTLGPRKPWRRPFLWPSLLGREVGAAEMAYWKMAPGRGPFGEGVPFWASLREADLALGRVVSSLRKKGLGR
ncbi:hypothetical protein SAMN05444156_0137 [Verrucomicrobium sp. GAS474]|nr:hypothetical protein SAMN05444156_0137 [Verrucomicrobium sp. GAS474]